MPTTNFSTISYSNWYKNSVLDTFMINNSNLSRHTNPSVLQTNVGTEHNVFVQGSSLKLPILGKDSDLVSINAGNGEVRLNTQQTLRQSLRIRSILSQQMMGAPQCQTQLK